MQSIKDIFWNSEERRVRALWRLMGQLLMFAILMFVLMAGLGFVAVGMLMTRSGPESISSQAVQQMINEMPLLMTLSMLTMGLALTISVWLAGRFLDRRPFADFGFRFGKDWWLDFGFGLFQGAFLMLLVFLAELALGWVSVEGFFVTRDHSASFLVALIPPLLIFLAVGFYEELFSRGYQLQNIAEGLNWDTIGPRGSIVIALLLSSVVFGLMHAGNPNASAISTVNLVIAGFQLALGYLLTGELAIPIGLHITWNFFQGNVFGFPVSGTDFRSATFISVRQGGPDLWTGGAFGPEAGIIGLIAMGLGILMTVAWVRWRYGQVELHTPLAEAPERPSEEVVPV